MSIAMEALRHVSERELYHRVTQPPYAERRRNLVTVFSARLGNDTGSLQVETKNYRTDTLVQGLSRAQPEIADNDAVEGYEARNQALHAARWELISLPKTGEKQDRIGLDRDNLVEVYKYLDLDPWLLGQLCRRSSGWTCCTFAEGVLNFQLLTSMYYIAWSVNTTRAATKTKAILMAQEHIDYSRWFSAEVMLKALLEDFVVSIEDPFGLANLVLLDLVSYMERELDSQWRAEIKNENLTGHGVFGYGYHDKISSLNTQHLAFAAREIGLSVGMVSYCIRLADLAECMVSDLEDEVEKFRATTLEGRGTSSHANPWTSHSSMIQLLNSNKKKIWNFKVEAKDADNRVRAQSDTIFALISNRHAEAARRDSGSMKTIAVMTMLFLPGTFFAALFAVPSLDWNGPTVITSNFWVYWAFTMPFTLVVFIAWMILSLDRPIINLKLVGRAIASHEIFRQH